MNLRKDNSRLGEIVTRENVTRVEPKGITLERYTRPFEIFDVSECADAQEVGEKIDAGTYRMVPSTECGGHSVVKDHHDNALTIVNSTFKLSQPLQTIAELETLQAPLGFKWSQAGFLNNGKKLFLKCDLGEFDVNGDGSDVIKKHLICLDGFDGGTARQILLGFVRMACSNGQLMYDVDSYVFKVKHTKNAQSRVDAALSEATGIKQRFQFLEDDLALLSTTDFSEKQVEVVARHVFPQDTKQAENNRERILEQFNNSSLGTFGRTAWDCFNGFTAYNNHDRSYRKTAITTSAENQFLGTEVNSRQFGLNVRKGIELALELN